mmetsp:Transcript_7199/g.9110  ORF Transcript_7199/g.9110 Transcript_7199/m.9110 type:complete len:214 (+) Transcript_7199:1035-1676(+)
MIKLRYSSLISCAYRDAKTTAIMSRGSEKLSIFFMLTYTSTSLAKNIPNTPPITKAENNDPTAVEGTMSHLKLMIHIIATIFPEPNPIMPLSPLMTRNETTGKTHRLEHSGGKGSGSLSILSSFFLKKLRVLRVDGVAFIVDNFTGAGASLISKLSLELLAPPEVGFKNIFCFRTRDGSSDSLSAASTSGLLDDSSFADTSLAKAALFFLLML